MESKIAWGVGLATVTDSGKTLDVWYPEPQLGQEDPEAVKRLTQKLSKLEVKCEARQVHTTVVNTSCDLEEAPQTAADAYLRLHALSHRLALPNTVNLDGIFEQMNLVVWTGAGPCDYENFDEVRLSLRAKLGYPVPIRSIDRLPRMVDYVLPSGVRIANGNNVRLGAYLSSGTAVNHAGFVNYNAGTLGSSTVEGRISTGVVIGDGTDIAGGASTAGTLATGPHARVSMGEHCLLGANSGLSIPLGDNCVVEPGLYLTVDTKVYLMPSGGVMPGAGGFFSEPRTLPASELAGVSNALFRRNSESGRVEAISRGGQQIEFAD